MHAAWSSQAVRGENQISGFCINILVVSTLIICSNPSFASAPWAQAAEECVFPHHVRGCTASPFRHSWVLHTLSEKCVCLSVRELLHTVEVLTMFYLCVKNQNFTKKHIKMVFSFEKTNKFQPIFI